MGDRAKCASVWNRKIEEKRTGEEGYYLRYRIVIDVNNLVQITGHDLGVRR